MKNLLNILVSFNIVFFNSFNLINCSVKSNDHFNDNVQSESNLQTAKQFLSKGITITDVLPGKTIKQYLEHIKKVNPDKISNNINFIYNDTYATVRLNQQEIDLFVILEDNKTSEPVWFKLKLLDKSLIIDNILNQAKMKIEQKPINGSTLLTTDKITGHIIKNRIIKLIENQIDNNNVKVDWSDQSTLTSLQINQENKGKVKLSITYEKILKSQTAYFSIVNVLDSEIKVNQKLVENAAIKIQQIDVEQESIQESVNLNDINFKTKIEAILENIIDNLKVVVTLKQLDATLKQQNNKISVTLSSGIDNRFEKDNITICLLNVLSDEKHKNKLILNQLKEELKLVNGNNLNSNFLINDERILNAINQKIQLILTPNDYLKIKGFNIFPSINLSGFAKLSFNPSNSLFKTVTLGSVDCVVNVLIKIGSVKDQVSGLTLVKLDNVAT